MIDFMTKNNLVNIELKIKTKQIKNTNNTKNEKENKSKM